jgi:predicted component of type VI protein secretion system
MGEEQTTMRELTIITPDGGESVLPLSDNTVTAGRDSKNSLVLPGAGISRRHLRIEWHNNGCQVTDLASTNGTLLEGHRLPPLKPHPWLPDIPLQAGLYIIRWRETSPAQNSIPNNSGSPRALSTHTAKPLVEPPALSLRVEPSRLHERGSLNVIVTNQSQQPVVALVRLSAPPDIRTCWEAWQTDALEPGSSQNQQVILTPRVQRAWFGRTITAAITFEAAVVGDPGAAIARASAELVRSPRLNPLIGTSVASGT